MVESGPGGQARVDARTEPTIVDLLQDDADGYIVLSPVGEVLFVNESAASMFKQEPEDLLGGSLDIEIESAGHEGTAELRIRQFTWQDAPAALIRLRDVTARRDEAAVAFRATHDAVTGLPNRYLFADRVDQVLARAERGERGIFLFHCSLVGADDGEGDDDARRGDGLRREAARRLALVLRPSDTIAYLGDDEFAILCDQLDGARAERIAGRLRSLFADDVVLDGHHLSAELKVGAVSVDDSLLDAEMLLEWAKKAASSERT